MPIKIITLIILLCSSIHLNAQNEESLVNELLKNSYSNELIGYSLYKIDDRNEHELYYTVLFDEYGNIVEDNLPANPKKHKIEPEFKATLNYSSSGRLVFREVKINLNSYENLIYRDRIDKFPDSIEFSQINSQLKRSYDSVASVIGEEYFIDEFVYTQMQNKHKLYISKAKFQMINNMVKPEPNVSFYTIEEGELVNYTKYNDRINRIIERSYENNLITSEKQEFGHVNSEIDYKYHERILKEVIIKVNKEVSAVIQFQFNETGKVSGYVKTNYLTGFSDSVLIKPVYR